MKKIISTLLLSFFLVASVNAQNCFKYLPGEGAKMEIKYFDGKDKETGSAVIYILDKVNENGGEKMNVKIEQSSPETDSVYTMEYAYICKDGKMYVDMSSYLGKTLDAYRAMDIEIDAEQLELPNNPSEGQELPGGNVVAQLNSNGMAVGKISVTVQNRKVEKIETISTPAGSFKCFKIVQETETRILLVKIKGSSAEWISEDAGVVRSETYNKKGKLLSYSLLYKLEK